MQLINCTKKDSSYRNISYFRFLLTLLSVIIGALALRSFIVEPTIVDGEIHADNAHGRRTRAC